MERYSYIKNNFFFLKKYSYFNYYFIMEGLQFYFFLNNILISFNFDTNNFY